MLRHDTVRVDVFPARRRLDGRALPDPVGEANAPRALGGLVGSLFFTGYLLTQYPGGRLGDRFGHREMIVLSLPWAGVLTALSGVVVGLIAFVGARVLTVSARVSSTRTTAR